MTHISDRPHTPRRRVDRGNGHAHLIAHLRRTDDRARTRASHQPHGDFTGPSQRASTLGAKGRTGRRRHESRSARQRWRRCTQACRTSSGASERAPWRRGGSGWDVRDGRSPVRPSARRAPEPLLGVRLTPQPVERIQGLPPGLPTFNERSSARAAGSIRKIPGVDTRPGSCSPGAASAPPESLSLGTGSPRRRPWTRSWGEVGRFR